MQLFLHDVDVLNDDAPLEIPSDEFYALGEAFVGAISTQGQLKDPQFKERWLANLRKLGLAPGENFAMTFLRQFLGQCALPGPWEPPKRAIHGRCIRMAQHQTSGYNGQRYG